MNMSYRIVCRLLTAVGWVVQPMKTRDGFEWRGDEAEANRVVGQLRTGTFRFSCGEKVSYFVEAL